MKAFEKWNKSDPGYCPLMENTIKHERRLAWRASLEEMLKHKHTNTDGLIYIDPLDVEKELEEKCNKYGERTGMTKDEFDELKAKGYDYLWHNTGRRQSFGCEE